MPAGENLLIVEDEDEWSQAYERQVNALDGKFNVWLAKDLATAERLIDATKFAVALVDVGLDIKDDHNVDGLRVMEKIRTIDKDTSIIVVTGRSGQDVLEITRDALKEHSALDAVAKGKVEPAKIRSLLQEGLEKYRELDAANRRSASAYQALRDTSQAMLWDHQLMEMMRFRGNISDLYQFLNRLIRDYLPIIPRKGQRLEFDNSCGVFHGDYWSRAVSSAVAVCFGPADKFDDTTSKNVVEGRLLGKYKTGEPLKELDGHGAKGAVFAIPEGRRDDYA